MKEWRDFRVQVMPMILMARSEKQKEKEDDLLLGRLKQLIVQITEQNTVNFSKIV